MYPTLRQNTEVTKRPGFSDKFKAMVPLEAVCGDKTAQELAIKYEVHPTQVTTWKRQAIDGLTGVFSDKVRRAGDNEAEVKELHAKIGNLAVEKRFSAISAEAMSPSERKALVRFTNKDLLSPPRSRRRIFTNIFGAPNIVESPFLTLLDVERLRKLYTPA